MHISTDVGTSATNFKIDHDNITLVTLFKAHLKRKKQLNFYIPFNYLT